MNKKLICHYARSDKYIIKNIKGYHGKCFLNINQKTKENNRRQNPALSKENKLKS